MSHSFYLHSDKETTGPFPLNDLETRRIAGELPPDAKIHDGQAWVPAAEFLARGTNPATAPTPAATPPVETSPAAVSTPAPSPTVDPDAMLRAALVLEKEPAPLLSGARWESLLFLLSFPVLIPSLIIMFVMAKRWGHIDIYLIIIDGLIFTMLGFLTGPWIGTMMLVSWISSVWLYWMRRDRQGHGIFLGYSYLISLLLVFGGAFAIGGFATMFPWNAYARWTAAREAPIVTTVERARERAIPRDRQIVLQGATLDFERAVTREKINGKWQFAAKQKPADVWFDQSGLGKLWSGYKAVVGREVELVNVRSTGFGGVRERVEIQEGETKRWLDTKSLHFTLVDGIAARVWVATSAPPGINSFSPRGIARAIFNDTSVAAAYAKDRRGNLPLMGIAIFDGETGPPPPPPPVAEAREVWVPVKDARGAFWVRFPEGATPTGNEPAAGYYIGDAEESPGLGAVSAQLFSRDHARVLYQQKTAAYVDEQLIFDQMKATIAWKNGLWLAAGLLILGGAVWRAREE